MKTSLTKQKGAITVYVGENISEADFNLKNIYELETVIEEIEEKPCFYSKT